MEILTEIYSNLRPILPMSAALAGTILLLVLGRLVLARSFAHRPGYPFKRQIATLLLSLFGLVAVILLMPITDSARGQLLSLLGILLSAAIALSSTTFLGNIMAGMMLRSIRNFKAGDFIHVEGNFGRVSDQGLFHVEIQGEDRNLTSMPNLLLVTNPVQVYRSTGSVISTEVSLGYDVPRRKVEALLLKAAEDAELKEPFVQVLALDDFSVNYRVAGLLEEVKHLISSRSILRQKVLDRLHEGDIEIVSPTFMNTRAVGEKRFIPSEEIAEVTDKPVSELLEPEKLMFDKADQAESLEKLKETYHALANEIEALKKRREKASDDFEQERLKILGDRLKTRRDRIGDLLKQSEIEEKSD
jgi:small-conductance mechanosensitive channel